MKIKKWLKKKKHFPETVVAGWKKAGQQEKNHKTMLSFHGDRKYCSTFNSAVWLGKLALLSLQGNVQTDEAT